jgi:hypothetical protein
VIDLKEKPHDETAGVADHPEEKDFSSVSSALSVSVIGDGSSTLS